MPRFDGEAGEFAPDSYLRIEIHDARALEKALNWLTEYESMRVDRENLEKKRAAERRSSFGGPKRR